MLKYLKRARDCAEDNESESPSTSKEVTNVEVRRYDDSYMALGFTWTGENTCQLPLCIVCGKKLANTAMVPIKLKRHFTSNHSNLSKKNVDYFQRLLKSQNNQSRVFEKAVTVSDKAQEASYLVAELVAKNMKSHTIAETLIMPACKIIVRTMLGKEAENVVDKIPISDNTISRRINDTLSGILRCGNFALQVDESIDITSKAQLLAFVRFEHDGAIMENFCFCKELPETTKGQDIFNILSAYLESCALSCSQCVGICTDGAPSMIGSIKGFVTLVKEKNPAVITTHCFIQREVLVFKTVGPDLKAVLDKIVCMVNFIMQRPLQSRIFAKLCKDIGKAHTTLLLHTEVRWLSRGKVLARVFELREELLIFFKSINKDEFCYCLEDSVWQMKLAYLSDIYVHLNALNTSMQGPKENILTSTDKLLAFKNKLNDWEKHISKGNMEMFPRLHQIQTDVDYEELLVLISSHLKSLTENLDKYFPSLSIEAYDWVRNPFSELPQASNNTMSLQEEEELTGLHCDRTLMIKFNEVTPDAFWISIRQEYPLISTKAVNILLQFSTSYLSEQAFSCLNHIKSKSRNCLLSVEEEMRVSLSKIRPNIQELTKKKQAQVSH